MNIRVPVGICSGIEMLLFEVGVVSRYSAGHPGQPKQCPGLSTYQSSVASEEVRLICTGHSHTFTINSIY